ncbi:arginyltransferase [Rhodovibrionaceae bacterium A322]
MDNPSRLPEGTGPKDDAARDGQAGSRDLSLDRNRKHQVLGPLQAYYQMPEMACPYLPNRAESKIITDLRGPLATARYNTLSRGGFRRSHHFAYRPACSDCQACVPVRVRALDFKPGKSHRRVINKNRDLTLQIRPAVFSVEHFSLFEDYVQSRHHDGEMAEMGADEYRAMVEDSHVETSFVEFRDPQAHLKAVCLVDWLDDGASAVYSYFDTQTPERSLGSYLVLAILAHLAQQKLPHLYLGYWINGAAKMEYKARFQPLEGLTPKGWKELNN